ncbi:MAG TPA: trypsin-like peptidase domain-containing protein, partial [Ktedonobacterales bacterium]|nr:trypsin-like peptidase domain-containing protein [Ktedonobacterales bacterium]
PTPYSPQPYYPQPYQSGTWAPPMPTPSGRPAARRGWIVPAAILVLLVLLAGAFAIGQGVGSSTANNNPAVANIGTDGPRVNVPASAQDLQQTLITVVHTVQPSVVEVTSRGGQGGAIGSGVVLTKDGYIATNDHVVAGFSTYTVTLSNGDTKSATLVGADPQDDLAVLKISASTLQPLAFADSSKVQVGEFAIALGNPLGFQQSATFGIVSALNRSASEGQGGPAAVLTGLVQTSAPINPGNSGGALVDLQGQLIGIPTLAAADPQSGTAATGIGFAIPSNRVKYVAQQLIQQGHLTTTGQGFIGVRGVDVTPQLAAANGLSVQSGVLVSAFANDASGKSPAQQAGVQTGDIITAVNGKTINDNGDLASALISLSPGTQVTLSIQRGNSQRSVKVTLGERPTNLQG